MKEESAHQGMNSLAKIVRPLGGDTGKCSGARLKGWVTWEMYSLPMKSSTRAASTLPMPPSSI